MTKSKRIFGICCINKFTSIKKILPVVFLCLVGNFVHGQDYSYEFVIQNVTNRSEAKDVTGLIRPVFNDEEEPFLCFPTFVEDEKKFDFKSRIDISRAQLEDVLSSQDLILTDFKRTERGDLAKNHNP